MATDLRALAALEEEGEETDEREVAAVLIEDERMLEPVECAGDGGGRGR